MSNRNNLVEFERFLFSILVVGYHTQSAFLGEDDSSFFENGANAVEFFFLVSGYFMARSIEKINTKENTNILSETFYFMKGKIKTILPTHIISNLILIISVLIARMPSWDKTLINGIPSLFLVQMVAVWNDSYTLALNIPEWYISSMLLCMLIMVPISLLLRKKINTFFVTLILVLILCLIITITGFCLNWSLPQNFVNDSRSWLEMCCGMFAFCLSNSIRNKSFNKFFSLLLKIIEILCYNVPVILGFAPINKKEMRIIMIVTVICTFFSLSITFGNKGVVIKNGKINRFFGYLGNISLPIYMFQTIAIGIAFFIKNVDAWVFYFIVIFATIFIAIIYKLIYDLIKKLIEKIKNRRQEKTIYTIIE